MLGQEKLAQLLEILALPENTSLHEENIRRAYRIKALQVHPDKGHVTHHYDFIELDDAHKAVLSHIHARNNRGPLG